MNGAGPRLHERRILLGISGSIAAYKACDLARRLMHEGATVRAVMTPGATKFVTPLTLQALTQQPVYYEVFNRPASPQPEHIAWARWAELLLVAPATADVLAKMAAGLADDPLSTLYLALSQVPVLVAPAMNTAMYEHPATQRSLEQLRRDGVELIEAGTGDLACGEQGAGRLAPLEQIIEAVVERLARRRDLKGLKVLITAGATREPFDAVRFVSNPSTGKMGFALAAEAASRGAETTLVCGPTWLATPPGVKRFDVATAQEMWQNVVRRWRYSDVVIFAAAVSDYRPADPRPGKLRKSDKPLQVVLEPTVDIAAEIGARARRARRKVLLVGFAAETGQLAARARAKLEAKGFDLIVANEIGRPDSGFSSDTSRAVLIPRQGSPITLPLLTKADLARRILDWVCKALRR